VSVWPHPVCDIEWDRFKVMADWAKFLRGEDASNVVPLRRGAAGE
jgi:hypothetical protein